MMKYRIVEGLHDEEENSYFAGEQMSPKVDFDSFEAATAAIQGLNPFPSGLYRHIPGVEAVMEQQDVRNNRIWLIRRIDNLSRIA